MLRGQRAGLRVRGKNIRKEKKNDISWRSKEESQGRLDQFDTSTKNRVSIDRTDLEDKDVRTHNELCAVIPTVSVTIMSSESMTELANILQQKWDHVFPVSSVFESEQFCWNSYWKRPTLGETSLSDSSLACVRRIRTWKRSTMITERLSNLSLIAMHIYFVCTTRGKAVTVVMSVGGEKCLFNPCNASGELHIFKTVAVQKIMATSKEKQDELYRTLSGSDILAHKS
ncbi:hypothetical protein GQR58_002718 [Nymphon striatum]|nr:hypothetical protein GQR58_002718 [Nymphon striatum]